MLDFGWAELFVVMAVAVLVIGPNEIPGVMRGLGRLMRRFQYIKHSLSAQFDDFMKDDAVSAVNFETLPDGHEAFDEQAEDEDVEMIVPKEEGG